MGVIDTIKGTISRKMEEHEAKQVKKSAELRDKRAKFGPLIRKVAQEYGADVELLDKAAYVSKKVKGEIRGVHIPYKGTADMVRMRLDRAFVGSSTASKVKSAIQTGKKVHKALKESGIGRGSMWAGQQQGGSSPSLPPYYYGGSGEEEDGGSSIDIRGEMDFLKKTPSRSTPAKKPSSSKKAKKKPRIEYDEFEDDEYEYHMTPRRSSSRQKSSTSSRYIGQMKPARKSRVASNPPYVSRKKKTTPKKRRATTTKKSSNQRTTNNNNPLFGGKPSIW